MSADDMLAAQLWPWPDPIIKRDAQGGIIFVNAAFLQLYGGQVSDWHGCAVEGWPAPVLGNIPNRFETRAASESGELVYDWLEYEMANGGAMAISRNVTALLQQTPPQESAMAPFPPMDEAPALEETYVESEMPITDETTMVEESVATEDDVLPVHTTEREADVEPAVEDTYVAEEPVQTEDIVVEETVEPVAEATPEVEAEPEIEEDRRAYERRALPIEDGDSLLGSNWRDAVIAKAVGSEVADVTENLAPEAAIDAEPAIAAPATTLTVGPNDNDTAIRILLAEDNAINALLTRTLLEADGCHVDVVEDGSLAVDAMRANKYDMIFMDMRMPNMDGLESTRKIRTLSEAAKTIPIVALTANAFDDDRNACFDAGMNDFMTKPVSAEELQQMVQTWTKEPVTAAA